MDLIPKMEYQDPSLYCQDDVLLSRKIRSLPLLKQKKPISLRSIIIKENDGKGLELALKQLYI